MALALLTQCSSCKNQDPSPEEQLPPITQTGTNTFGCLINGQPYLPEGNNGTSNYAVLYDPGYNGGSLDIRTYQKTGQSDKFISLGGDYIHSVGNYSLPLGSNRQLHYTDISQPALCGNFNYESSLSYRKGTLTITRLDLQAGIISGTFECTLAKPGCDTIRITQGRFDKKL